MAETRIDTLDLNFQGWPGAIATYLIRRGDAAVLVESGPGSTRQQLTDRLKAHGLAPRDVSHVLLTHIHLDHAGAAGWLASQGAQIVVHPVGAPHLVDPTKLLRSARRIYGDDMDKLWGETLPVAEAQIHVPTDADEVRIGNLAFTAIDTPGHAEHHLAYLFEDLCFSGDVGGVRLPGFPLIRVPMPPPELHFEKWRASIERLQKLGFRRIAPTHFGIYTEADRHLRTLAEALESTLRWLEVQMRDAPDVEALRRRFLQWSDEDAARHGLSSEVTRAFDLANPLGMSADGLFRYWHKVRNAASA